MRGKIFVLLALLPSILLASEVRLQGLAGFRILVLDDANQLNLLDFAGNPAGLVLDEPCSTVEWHLLRFWINQREEIQYWDPLAGVRSSEVNLKNYIWVNRFYGVVRDPKSWAFAIRGYYNSTETWSEIKLREEIRIGDKAHTKARQIEAIWAAFLKPGKTTVGLRADYRDWEPHHKAVDVRIGFGFYPREDVTMGISTGCRRDANRQKFFKWYWRSDCLLHLIPDLQLGLQVVWQAQKLKDPSRKYRYYAGTKIRSIYSPANSACSLGIYYEKGRGPILRWDLPEIALEEYDGLCEQIGIAITRSWLNGKAFWGIEYDLTTLSFWTYGKYQQVKMAAERPFGRWFMGRIGVQYLYSNFDSVKLSMWFTTIGLTWFIKDQMRLEFTYEYAAGKSAEDTKDNNHRFFLSLKISSESFLNK